jgi:hypothetical protein
MDQAQRAKTISSMGDRVISQLEKGNLGLKITKTGIGFGTTYTVVATKDPSSSLSTITIAAA